MCAREGCLCDAAGLDASEGRLWDVRDFQLCIVHDRALEGGVCMRCTAERPGP